VKLTEAMPKLRPLRETMPDLAAFYERRLGIENLPTEPHPPRVLGTRRAARELLERTPEPPTTLDFDGIEVATSPFLDELRTAWPNAQPENMNEDLAATWDLLTENYEKRRRRRG